MYRHYFQIRKPDDPAFVPQIVQSDLEGTEHHIVLGKWFQDYYNKTNDETAKGITPAFIAALPIYQRRAFSLSDYGTRQISVQFKYFYPDDKTSKIVQYGSPNNYWELTIKKKWVDEND